MVRFAVRFTVSSSRTLLFAVAILCHLLTPVIAGASSPGGTRLIPPELLRPFHRLTVNEGLSQDLSIFIHQDVKGFMWFGTAGGLNRYDGVEFKRYGRIEGIPRQPVYFYSFFEENDTTMWLGTDAGMLRYNPATNQGIIISHGAIAAHAGTLEFSSIIKVREGVLLYYLYEVGFVRLETASNQLSLITPVHSIHQNDGKGIAAIVHAGAGRALALSESHLLEYDERTRSFREMATLPAGKSGRSLWFDRTGNVVWIGTTQGLFKFAGNSINPVPLPRGTGSSSRETAIMALLADSRGYLWLGLLDGLAVFHPVDNTLLTFTNHQGNPQSIPSGAVRYLFEDRTQNLWISVQDKGIARLDLKPLKFGTIRNSAGFPKQLAGMLVSGLAVTSRGDLWIAAEGLHYVDFDRKTISEFPISGTSLEKEEAKRSMRIVVVRDSLLCVRSQGRVYLFAPERNSIRPLVVSGVQYTEVKNMYVRPSSGNLVMFLPDSIIEVNLERRQRITTLARYGALISRVAVCTSIMEDRSGALWFGTNLGLFVHDAQGGLRRFDELSATDPIPPNQPVLSLSLSGNKVLWIGTDAGLRRLDLTTRATRGFTVAEGLPNDKIWVVQVDRNNSVWLGTNRGLVRLREGEDDSIALRSYTYADGLPSNEFSMNVKGMDGKGTLFFGTGEGVVYFSPENLADNPYGPQVVLTGAHLYGIPMPLERDAPFVQRIVIPYDKKILSFSYAALEFTDPARNTYSYYLEGYDATWNDAGRRREAFYTNLDPGEYTFRVKAMNKDGIEGDGGLAVNLVIVPPFWMTWWFRGLAALVLVGIIGGTIRFIELRKIKARVTRLEQERALERERSRISRDMHDELGANLTSLSMMTEIARRSLDNRQQADEQLKKAGTIATETVRKLDEIVWAVNPKADTLANLAAYISEYAQEFFGSTTIRVRFDFPVTLPDLHLPSDVRHNVFLTVKEAMNNIAKHSGATETTIGLHVGGNVMTLTVADNGKGCDKLCETQLGNGVINMRQRIETVGGEIRFSHGAGHGMVVTITLPCGA